MAEEAVVFPLAAEEMMDIAEDHSSTEVAAPVINAPLYEAEQHIEANSSATSEKTHHILCVVNQDLTEVGSNITGTRDLVVKTRDKESITTESILNRTDNLASDGQVTTSTSFECINPDNKSLNLEEKSAVEDIDMGNVLNTVDNEENLVLAPTLPTGVEVNNEVETISIEHDWTRDKEVDDFTKASLITVNVNDEKKTSSDIQEKLLDSENEVQQVNLITNNTSHNVVEDINDMVPHEINFMLDSKNNTNLVDEDNILLDTDTVQDGADLEEEIESIEVHHSNSDAHHSNSDLKTENDNKFGVENENLSDTLNVIPNVGEEIKDAMSQDCNSTLETGNNTKLDAENENLTDLLDAIPGLNQEKKDVMTQDCKSTLETGNNTKLDAENENLTDTLDTIPGLNQEKKDTMTQDCNSTLETGNNTKFGADTLDVIPDLSKEKEGNMTQDCNSAEETENTTKFGAENVNLTDTLDDIPNVREETEDTVFQVCNSAVQTENTTKIGTENENLTFTLDDIPNLSEEKEDAMTQNTNSAVETENNTKFDGQNKNLTDTLGVIPDLGEEMKDAMSQDCNSTVEIENDTKLGAENENLTDTLDVIPDLNKEKKDIVFQDCNSTLETKNNTKFGAENENLANTLDVIPGLSEKKEDTMTKDCNSAVETENNTKSVTEVVQTDAFEMVDKKIESEDSTHMLKIENNSCITITEDNLESMGEIGLHECQKNLTVHTKKDTTKVECSDSAQTENTSIIASVKAESAEISLLSAEEDSVQCHTKTDETTSPFTEMKLTSEETSIKEVTKLAEYLELEKEINLAQDFKEKTATDSLCNLDVSKMEDALLEMDVEDTNIVKCKYSEAQIGLVNLNQDLVTEVSGAKDVAACNVNLNSEAICSVEPQELNLSHAKEECGNVNINKVKNETLEEDMEIEENVSQTEPMPADLKSTDTTEILHPGTEAAINADMTNTQENIQNRCTEEVLSAVEQISSPHREELGTQNSVSLTEITAKSLENTQTSDVNLKGETSSSAWPFIEPGMQNTLAVALKSAECIKEDKNLDEVGTEKKKIILEEACSTHSDVKKLDGYLTVALDKAESMENTQHSLEIVNDNKDTVPETIEKDENRINFNTENPSEEKSNIYLEKLNLQNTATLVLGKVEEFGNFDTENEAILMKEKSSTCAFIQETDIGHNSNLEATTSLESTQILIDLSADAKQNQVEVNLNAHLNEEELEIQNTSNLDSSKAETLENHQISADLNKLCSIEKKVNFDLEQEVENVFIDSTEIVKQVMYTTNPEVVIDPAVGTSSDEVNDNFETPMAAFEENIMDIGSGDIDTELTGSASPPDDSEDQTSGIIIISSTSLALDNSDFCDAENNEENLNQELDQEPESISEDEEPQKMEKVSKMNKSLTSTPKKEDMFKVLKITTDNGIQYIRIPVNLNIPSITNMMAKSEMNPNPPIEENVKEAETEELIEETTCKGCDLKLTKPNMYHSCTENWCRFCQKQLPSSFKFELHTIEQHLVNMRQCAFCEADLASVQLLEMHLLKTHTQLRLAPSVCVGCRSKFRTNEGRHRHSCTTELLCKVCNVIFSSDEKLQHHKTTQHKLNLDSTEESIEENEDKEDIEKQIKSLVTDLMELVVQEDEIHVLEKDSTELLVISKPKLQNIEQMDSAVPEEASHNDKTSPELLNQVVQQNHVMEVNSESNEMICKNELETLTEEVKGGMSEISEKIEPGMQEVNSNEVKKDIQSELDKTLNAESLVSNQLKETPENIDKNKDQSADVEMEYVANKKLDTELDNIKEANPELNFEIQSVTEVENGSDNQHVKQMDVKGMDTDIIKTETENTKMASESAEGGIQEEITVNVEETSVQEKDITTEVVSTEEQNAVVTREDIMVEEKNEPIDDEGQASELDIVEGTTVAEILSKELMGENAVEKVLVVNEDEVTTLGNVEATDSVQTSNIEVSKTVVNKEEIPASGKVQITLNETMENTTLEMQVFDEDKTDMLDTNELSEETENELKLCKKPQKMESVFINELISNISSHDNDDSNMDTKFDDSEVVDLSELPDSPESKNIDQEPSTDYTCDICDRNLKSEPDLENHRAWHFESCATPLFTDLPDPSPLSPVDEPVGFINKMSNSDSVVIPCAIPGDTRKIQVSSNISVDTSLNPTSMMVTASKSEPNSSNTEVPHEDLNSKDLKECTSQLKEAGYKSPNITSLSKLVETANKIVSISNTEEKTQRQEDLDSIASSEELDECILELNETGDNLLGTKAKVLNIQIDVDGFTTDEIAKSITDAVSKFESEFDTLGKQDIDTNLSAEESSHDITDLKNETLKNLSVPVINVTSEDMSKVEITGSISEIKDSMLDMKSMNVMSQQVNMEASIAVKVSEELLQEQANEELERPEAEKNNKEVLAAETKVATVEEKSDDRAQESKEVLIEQTVQEDEEVAETLIEQTVQESKEVAETLIEQTVQDSKEVVETLIEKNVEESDEVVETLIEKTVEESKEVVKTLIEKTVEESKEVIETLIEKTVEESKEVVETLIEKTVEESKEVEETLPEKTVEESKEVEETLPEKTVEESNEVVETLLEKTVEESDEVVEALLEKTVEESKEVVETLIEKTVQESKEVVETLIEKTVQESKEVVETLIEKTVEESDGVVETLVEKTVEESKEVLIEQTVQKDEEVVEALIEQTVQESKEVVEALIEKTVEESKELVEALIEQTVSQQKNTANIAATLPCPHCSKFFPSSSSLNCHFIEVQFCKFCQQIYPQEYQHHMVEYHSMEKTCQFCDKAFRHPKDLSNHMKMHTNIIFKPFICSKCNCSFNKTDYLKHNKCQEPLKNKSVLELNKVCEKCEIYFQSDSSLENHMIEHHSVKDICPICKEKFSSMLELVSHLALHSNAITDIVYKCQKCQLSTSDESEFDNHECLKEDDQGLDSSSEDQALDSTMDDQGWESSAEDQAPDSTVDEPVTCETCQEEFTNEEDKLLHVCTEEKLDSNFCIPCGIICDSRLNYEEHMMSKHSTKLTCQFCSKNFQFTQGLMDHIKIHTKIEHPLFKSNKTKRARQEEISTDTIKKSKLDDKNELMCKFCNVSYLNRKSYELHMMEYHSSIDKCQFCNKHFGTRAAVAKHIVIHTELPHMSFKCSTCNSAYSNAAALIVHQMEPCKEFYCEWCEAVFQCKEDLTTHDSKEHNLCCESCYQYFKTKEELKLHIREHSNTKNLTCVNCNKKFESRKDKADHECSFKCKQCSKVFTLLSSLKSHEKKAHETEAKIKCLKCPRLFKSAHHMKIHLKAHSKNETTKESKLEKIKEKKQKASTKSVAVKTNKKKQNIKIKCKICKFEFTNYVDRNLHICDSSILYCKICSLNMETRNEYEEHMIENHSTSENCQFCDQKFRQTQSLLLHLSKHTALKPVIIKCEYCKQKYCKGEEFEFHNCVRKREFKCQACPKDFSSHFWLASHLTKFHNIMDFLPEICGTCDTQFSNRRQLHRHPCPVGLIQEEPYISLPYAKDSKSSTAINVQIKEEIVVKTEQMWDDDSTWAEDDDNRSDGHMCPHCEDIFDTVFDMNKHLCDAFYCKHCNLGMASKKAFNTHMMSQHCKYDTCQFCDSTFQDKQELITHLETHTTIKFKLPTDTEVEEKKYYCQFCKRSLSSKHNYDLHMMKKHCLTNKCQFCEQKFKLKTKLIAHIATHTKLPYPVLNKCAKCNKEFADDLQEINHICAMDAKKTDKVDAKKTDKVDAKKTDKVDAKKTDKVDAKKTDKVDAKKTDKVDAKKTDKVEEQEIKIDANTEAATAKKLCLICNQKFFKKLSFETHMMDLHQMKYKCQFCGYCAKLRAVLIRHMATHTSIKPKSTCLQCSELCVISTHECPKKRKISETQTSSETESEKKRARKDIPAETEDSSSSEDEREEEDDIEAPIKIKKEKMEESSSSTLRCLLCPSLFVSKNAMHTHLKNHHRVDVTSLQQLQGTTESESINSKETADTEEALKCRHCNIKFGTHAELRLHGQKARVYCEFCKKTYPSQGEYETHMLNQHSMDRTCQFCGAQFGSKAGLLLHLRKHTTMKPIFFKCFGCGDKFRTKLERQHHDCLAWHCDACDKRFKSEEALLSHQKSHKTESRVRCELCTKTFIDREALLEHVQSIHAVVDVEPTETKKRTRKAPVGRPPKQARLEDQITFPCDGHCTKTFPTYALLEQHKKCVCTTCNQEFSSAFECDSHQAEHNQFKCSLCDKEFKHEASLMRHMPLHKKNPSTPELVVVTSRRSAPSTSAQPEKKQPESVVLPPRRAVTVVQPAKAVKPHVFSCEECGKTCSTSFALKMHKKTHEVFQCELCTKVFTSAQKLSAHIRLHSTPVVTDDSDDEPVVILELPPPSAANQGQFVLLD